MGMGIRGNVKVYVSVTLRNTIKKGKHNYFFRSLHDQGLEGQARGWEGIQCRGQRNIRYIVDGRTCPR